MLDTLKSNSIKADFFLWCQENNNNLLCESVPGHQYLLFPVKLLIKVYCRKKLCSVFTRIVGAINLTILWFTLKSLTRNHVVCLFLGMTRTSFDKNRLLNNLTTLVLFNNVIEYNWKDKDNNHFNDVILANRCLKVSRK